MDEVTGRAGSPAAARPATPASASTTAASTRRPAAPGEGRGQLGAHVGDAFHGACVGAVDVTPVDEGVGDDRDGVLEVVEDEHRVGQQERHLGEAEVVRRRVRQRLQAPHEVVAEVADEAARNGGRAAASPLAGGR